MENRYWLLWPISLALISCIVFSVMGESKSMRVFQDQEIKVTFPEDGFSQKEISAKQGTNYFSQYTTHIRFCKQPKQPSYVQQVYSADGWLCNFYILPPWPKAKIKAELMEGLDSHDHITYHNETGVGEEVIKGHLVLVWRHQRGKTRLDHFLVFGKNHHYLFVSSAYGDRERIREVVKTLTFIAL